MSLIITRVPVVVLKSIRCLSVVSVFPCFPINSLIPQFLKIDVFMRCQKHVKLKRMFINLWSSCHHHIFRRIHCQTGRYIWIQNTLESLVQKTSTIIHFHHKVTKEFCHGSEVLWSDKTKGKYLPVFFLFFFSRICHFQSCATCLNGK